MTITPPNAVAAIKASPEHERSGDGGALTLAGQLQKIFHTNANNAQQKREENGIGGGNHIFHN